MKFSIVIPSFLGEYRGAAAGREIKIHRAIQSALNQDYTNCEIILIADGCQQSYDIGIEYRLNTHLIQKQKTWSAYPRKLGCEIAKGDWICYLDIDDFLLSSHIGQIASQINDFDWVCFNDWHVDKDLKLYEKDVSVKKQSGTSWLPGTSNIAHKRDLGKYWLNDTYAHDRKFIGELLNLNLKFDKINIPGYVVCHIPGKYDL